MTPEQEMIKELMKNQSVMIDAIKDLSTENAEIKAQLAGSTPGQGKKTAAVKEASQAEIDEVFKNIM